VISRAALCLCLFASVAQAQVFPQPTGGDNRLQTVAYDPTQIVQLRGTPGYQITVELSPDEQVQSVAVGDGTAWQISVNAGRNLLFIKPTDSARVTNMTAITDVRVYNFELLPMPGPSPDMAYHIKFRFAGPETRSPTGDFGDMSAATRRLSRYRITGDRRLRPASISHDGYNTYIVWPKELDLPATYEFAGRGQELLVNGVMRDDVLVIDRVITHLVFRRDKSVARAVLLPPKGKS
jgi:type IV secretion system protein VirB9